MKLYVIADPMMPENEVRRRITIWGLDKFRPIVLRDREDVETKFKATDKYEWVEIGTADSWVRLQIKIPGSIPQESLVDKCMKEWSRETGDAYLQYLADEGARADV